MLTRITHSLLLISEYHNHDKSRKKQEQPHEKPQGGVTPDPMQIEITDAEHDESHGLSGEREIYEKGALSKGTWISWITDLR